ncbi:glycosyltransferase family 4 protein [Winogradskyella marincola]|uniref:Glycosyltransferase family 4 protein n=1 Tax=Winogradskyella marincola TaxID=3037795 RepID=A0ABT6FYA9_9FLAO|nr:glycosyltransferase family 4 protein [Winogradskyella sp. YYF002]MDG4714775.1 glycosyltransferase family 4 protein [Winogradskyella sp. YYF002]
MIGKRVVVMHPAYWEQAMGGAELQIYYLIKHLKTAGYEVHYVFEDKKIPYKNILNVQLHPLHAIKIKKTFGQRWFLYKAQLEKKLNEIKPDAIYTRLYSSWGGFAADYSLSNDCKYICAVASDNDLKVIKNVNLLLKPFNIVERYYANRSYKKATFVLVQNNFQAQRLKGKYNREGVKVNQSTEFVNEEDIRKERSPINVLWIANFKKLKRPELFIQLVERLRSFSNINFKMIGRGTDDYKVLLNKSCLRFENFEYLGEMSNKEVNKLLLKSHILVNTSDFEGFSNTFVQAWMRKVVVLSMNSNPDHILTTKKIGYVCPTVDLLAEKIEILLQNSELRKAMGQKAYNYAVSEHDVEKNINKVIRLMS